MFFGDKIFCTRKNIFLILGGVTKQFDIEEINRYRNFIAKIYLIGQCANEFAKQLSRLDIQYIICNDMENAVKSASKDADSIVNGYVILSPACASFDQYNNFVERGNHFKSIVNDLLNKQYKRINMNNKLFARTDKSTLALWWWNVDRWSFLLISLLVFIGVMLVAAASPAVAIKLHLNDFYFVKLHLLYVFAFFIVVFIISLSPLKYIKRGALLFYIASIVLLVMTVLFGFETKGAKRWIRIMGFSLQPSEFIKPALVILTAWMLDEKSKNKDIPGNIFAFVFYIAVVILLVLQPDMGMLFLVSAVFFIQLFLSGLPLLWFVFASFAGLVSGIIAYFVFPHVEQRINLFFNPKPSGRFTDRYQITQSLDAFNNGGLWGVGPGEGVVKNKLPDSHADFIFAVAGEEYGAVFCILVVLLLLAFF